MLTQKSISTLKREGIRVLDTVDFYEGYTVPSGAVAQVGIYSGNTLIQIMLQEGTNSEDEIKKCIDGLNLAPSDTVKIIETPAKDSLQYTVDIIDGQQQLSISPQVDEFIDEICRHSYMGESALVEVAIIDNKPYLISIEYY